MPNKNSISLKQPKVFPLALITAGWERFGFYILIAAMVLYLEKYFGFSDKHSDILFSIFNALVFLTPAIGGYLADNIFGIRRSIVAGLILEGLGLFLLAFSSQIFLYIGLSLVILGVGFFKTAPTDLMGRSYEAKDPRIDSGFTWFYLAMNLGASISMVLAGFLQQAYGWHIIFICAAISLYLGSLSYFFMRKRAEENDVAVGKTKLPLKTWSKLALGTFAVLIIGAFLLYKPLIGQLVFYIITFCILLYFMYEIIKSPRKEKLKIIACLSLIFMGMIFFIMYFQLFMSVTLFIDRGIQHSIFGLKIPTIAFVSCNPIWIVILSPLLVSIYNFLGKRKKDLAVTTKFPLGILFISLCFFVLRVGILFPNSHLKISAWWYIASIGFFSLGELLVSALGVAMVTHIAPPRLYGIMMGTWFLIATSVGTELAGSVSNLAAIPKALHDQMAILNTYGRVFTEIGVAGVILTILAFIAGFYIKRIIEAK